jgi:hypothetical protein
VAAPLDDPDAKAEALAPTDKETDEVADGELEPATLLTDGDAETEPVTDAARDADADVDGDRVMLTVTDAVTEVDAAIEAVIVVV